MPRLGIGVIVTDTIPVQPPRPASSGSPPGAIIGGAIASQAQALPPPPPATVDPQLAAYCARRYRSFDAVTGTYLARTGERIVCTY